MASSPSIPASGTGANPWPAARTAVVVSLGRMRKIFPTKLPPSLPLAAWIRKKNLGRKHNPMQEVAVGGAGHGDM